MDYINDDDDDMKNRINALEQHRVRADLTGFAISMLMAALAGFVISGWIGLCAAALIWLSVFFAVVAKMPWPN